MRNGCKRSKRQPRPRPFALELLENRVVLSGGPSLLAETALVRTIEPEAEIVWIDDAVATSTFEEAQWSEPESSTYFAESPWIEAESSTVAESPWIEAESIPGEETGWIEPDSTVGNELANENPGGDPAKPGNDTTLPEGSFPGAASFQADPIPPVAGNPYSLTDSGSDPGVVMPDPWIDMPLPDPDEANTLPTENDLASPPSELDFGNADTVHDFMQAMEMLDGGDADTVTYLLSLHRSLAQQLPEDIAMLVTNETPAAEWTQALVAGHSVGTDLTMGTSKPASADLVPWTAGQPMPLIHVGGHHLQVIDQGVEAADSLRLVPMTSDLAYDVLPLDLASLETGVQEFFAQIESLGRQLVGTPAGAQLYLWIMAAATASTAFEVARRQVQQPSYRLALASAGRGDTWTWFPGWASSHTQG